MMVQSRAIQFNVMLLRVTVRFARIGGGNDARTRHNALLLLPVSSFKMCCLDVKLRIDVCVCEFRSVYIRDTVNSSQADLHKG